MFFPIFFSFFFLICFSLKKTRKNPKNEKTHEQHEQKTCLFFDGGKAGIAQNLEKPNFPSRNVHVFFTCFHFFSGVGVRFCGFVLLKGSCGFGLNMDIVLKCRMTGSFYMTRRRV
jgi:hypothetical protein